MALTISGSTVTGGLSVPDAGRASAANSRPVALSTEDLAAITAIATALGILHTDEGLIHSDDAALATQTTLAQVKTGIDTVNTNLTNSQGAALPAGTNMIGHFGGTEYETVGASATDQIMGAGSGAPGDYFGRLLIQPTSTTVGTVTVKDGATVIYNYPGGTVSAALYPILVNLGIKAATKWTVSTGAGVTVLAMGDFT